MTCDFTVTYEGMRILRCPNPSNIDTIEHKNLAPAARVCCAHPRFQLPNGDPPASGGSSPRLPNATGNRAGAGGCTASEHMESPA